MDSEAPADKSAPVAIPGRMRDDSDGDKRGSPYGGADSKAIGSAEPTPSLQGSPRGGPLHDQWEGPPAGGLRSIRSLRISNSLRLHELEDVDGLTSRK